MPKTPKTPYFKGMTDEALADAIDSIRALLWNASQMNDAPGVMRLTRQLDLAVNVRRARIRRPATAAEVQAENARMFRAEVA